MRLFLIHNKELRYFGERNNYYEYYQRIHFYNSLSLNKINIIIFFDKIFFL